MAQTHLHSLYKSEGGSWLPYPTSLCGWVVAAFSDAPDERRNTHPEKVTCKLCRKSRAWPAVVAQNAERNK